MAAPKLLIVSLFVSLLLLLLHFAEAFPPEIAPTPADAAPVRIDCGSACKARCSKSKRRNLCERACGSCCTRCNCVPPGTYGNYDACYCYANLTTRGGVRKCP